MNLPCRAVSTARHGLTDQNCSVLSNDLPLHCAVRYSNANPQTPIRGHASFCCLTKRSPTVTRILIADDSPPMRCGLRTFLELNSDWQVCGEAVDGADAVKKAHQLAPDLIVMDFSMPEMDGVEAAREIARSGTDIPILLLSLHLSPQMIESARRAGMRGAISKAEISKMRYAIKALQRGETFFYPN